MNNLLTLHNIAPMLQGRSLYPGISLSVRPNTVIAIMGASGVGKSLLLRSIDCKTQHSGTISYTGKCFNVFQDHRQLFPWMTVKQNLDLVSTSYQDLIQEWQLDSLLTRRPTEMSIGQRQQFTLLRALTQPNQLLLCDEPLSAVDGITKLTLAQKFRQFVINSNRSALWVTHDAMEACTISDQILILKKDKFVVVDRANTTPEKLFEQVQ